jgi:hypothetical protein
VNFLSSIYALFNTAVNSGSLSFKVLDVSGVNPVHNLSYNSVLNKMTYGQTSALTPQDVYTASLTGVTDIYGDLAPPMSWNFSTPVNPLLISFGPANSSISNIQSFIYGGFNTAVVTGINAITLAGNPVGSNPTYNTGILKFNQTGNLGFSTSYVPLISGITDVFGNPVAPFSWLFTTVVQPAVLSFFPASGATTAVNTLVTATFNTLVNSGSLSFVVVSPTGPVAHSNLYNSGTNILTFNQNSNFAFAATESVALTGVTDIYGNAVPGTFWLFTTSTNDPGLFFVNLVPPTGSTNVNPGTAVLASFNTVVNSGLLKFVLLDSHGVPVPGYSLYDSGNSTVSYANPFALNYLTNYTVSLTGAMSAFGDVIPPTSWAFQTANGATGGGGGGGAGGTFRVTIGDGRSLGNLQINIIE